MVKAELHTHPMRTCTAYTLYTETKSTMTTFLNETPQTQLLGNIRRRRSPKVHFKTRVVETCTRLINEEQCTTFEQARNTSTFITKRGRA